MVVSVVVEIRLIQTRMERIFSITPTKNQTTPAPSFEYIFGSDVEAKYVIDDVEIKIGLGGLKIVFKNCL